MNPRASIWLRPRPLAALGLIALALLVWFVGPLLSIGAQRPLETQSSRIALAGVAVALWAAAQGWRRWNRWRADDLLLRGLATGVGDEAGAAPPGELPQGLGESLRSLFGTARLNADASPGAAPSIAERPWYVVLGDTDDDKARLLTGLGDAARVRHPLTGHVGGTASSPASGTNAPGFDWLVFKEATLIDAAWTGHEPPLDDAAVSSAWNRLFSRVRAARGRRPIDGMILTVSAAELLRDDAATRDARCIALHTTLQQFTAHSGASTPVFVVVTGMDGIAGFPEVFDDLDPVERDRPWGFELAHAGASNSVAAREFEEGVDRFAQALRERCVERMEASNDPARRAAVYLFGQEFAGLRNALGEWVASVLPSRNIHDGLRLHGVYLVGCGASTDGMAPVSSSLLTAATSMSRALQRDFGIDPAATPATSLAARKPSGSFFLKRLLSEVLLVEPGLQRRRQVAWLRRGQIRLGGYAVLGVAATVLVVAWLASFSRNIGYVAEVRSRPAEVRRSIDALPPATNGDVTLLPPVLTAVRNLAAPDGFRVDESPWLGGLGLYQGDKLDVAAVLAYEHLLDHALMPRLSHRLEERLRAARSDNLEQAYEALKSYLMVYTPDKFDAESLGAWVRMDWDASIGSRLGADERAALDRHLDALLRRGAPKAVTPIDMALVERTRNLLAEYPLENRVYSRLRRVAASAGLSDFTLAGAAGPQAAAVFARASGQPISRGIPGLYTRDGYDKALQASIDALTLQLANEESWVLGIGASDGRGGVAGAVNAAEAAARRAREIAGGQLSNRVRRLYFDDFIRQWDAYIADMRLVNVDSLDKARLLAQVLAGTDSPLLSLARAIARETTLTPAPDSAGRATAALSTALDQAAASRNDAARRSGTTPSAADAGAPSGQVERVVDDHFAAFHRLVDGKRAPIEQSLRLFDRVNAQLNEIDLAQRRRMPLPASTGLAESRQAAASQPEPIRSMLQSLVDTGLAALAAAPAGGNAPGATRPARSP